MLQITVPGREDWDEIRNEFVSTKDTTLQLEHSLVSVSKWESKWHVPFLTKQEKTLEQTIDYVRCMTLTQHVDPNVYKNLTVDNIKEVFAYIEEPMTATTVSDSRKKGGRNQIVTSELIYYWMIAFNIPFECQKWHLNRLIMLIRVCEAENRQDKKKISKKDMYSNRAALNAARRKKYNTRG